MSETQFEQMKRFVGFDAETGATLHALRDTGPDLNRLVNRFYDRIEQDDAARAVVAAHSSRDALSLTLTRWLREFLDGPWDEAYYERRRRIGARHVQIGLQPHYVFTAMNVLRLGLDQASVTQQMRDAVNKLMDLELGIVTNAYWTHIGDELQRSERMATIGEMAGSFAHEIRNPLSAMRNASWFLSRTLSGDADDRVSRHLSVMEQKIKETSRLVASLLEFARLRPAVHETVRVDSLIGGALEDLEVPESIEIAVAPADPALTVPVDRAQLVSVLRNLVQNAIQAIQGMDRPVGRVAFEVSATDDRVRIAVADDGPGIAREQHGAVFRPLVTTRVYGLGLGLAYCRRVVEAHQGVLSLESTPGEGARFTVELPR